jgi:hypothetical protein
MLNSATCLDLGTVKQLYHFCQNNPIMRTITLLVLQFAVVFQILAQSSEAIKLDRSLKVHSITLAANVFPYSQIGNENKIPSELPIGRFQPSVSLYRDNPDKWLELTLLVLRPNLTKSVLDTSTYLNPANSQLELIGQAGTFKSFHSALGISRGKLRKSTIFGLRSIVEYGALIGHRNYTFTNRADVFPELLDFKSKKWYAGINFALGLRLLDKRKFNLDVKLQNYFTINLERKYLSDGKLYSTLLANDISYFIPMIGLRLPMR